MIRAQSRYRSSRQFTKHLLGLLLVLVVLLIAMVISAFAIRFRFGNTLQVWFFDIGQGDATFIQTPEGKQILVDGGPDDRVLQKLASVMLPWDRTIDAIVVTHPDADHITGLVSVLERYDVGLIIETGARGTTPIIRALSDAIDQEATEYRLVKTGEQFSYDKLNLEVMWPRETFEDQRVDDQNNTSVVLLATYGETTMLLTGDAEKEAEQELLATIPDVDVLKAGHHGSVSSTTASFLQRVKPEVTTISAGVENRYGHPHPVVLERLREIGSLILRTDQDGDLLLTSTGGEPEVRPYPLPF